MRVAFVIATRNRPRELRRALNSLVVQSCRPQLVVVVDSSDPGCVVPLPSFASTEIRRIPWWPPSASKQRNVGLDALPDDVDLVGFMDDDAVLEREALARMVEFWQAAPPNVAAAGFNPLGQPWREGARRWRWVERLGLYCSRPGGVAPSGWQSVWGTVSCDTEVEWLPTMAIWRAGVLRRHRFDEFFDRYSYLEDLDFSYGLHRQGWRLFVVSTARYMHYPSPSGRISAREFGKIEVRNRLYFVRKHRLSLTRCYAAILLRAGMTLLSALGGNRHAWARALGNFEALLGMAR